MILEDIAKIAVGGGVYFLLGSTASRVAGDKTEFKVLAWIMFIQ
jgi:hypothetical protein